MVRNGLPVDEANRFRGRVHLEEFFRDLRKGGVVRERKRGWDLRR